MSPSKFHNERRVVINGPRPTQLKIKKESQVINKQNNHNQPVIIYANSPKIIHTKPHDFMALVQKLTGLSPPPSRDEETTSPPSQQPSPVRGNCVQTKPVKIDDKNSSLSPSFNVIPNQFLADIPLFTPNSTNLFFSPRGLYRYGEGSALSPSLFESKIKELPHY